MGRKSQNSSDGIGLVLSSSSCGFCSHTAHLIIFFLIIKYRVPCSSYLPSPSLSLDHFETYRLRMGKAKSFKDEFTSGLFFFPYNLLLLRLLFSFFLLILHNQRVIWICIHYLLVYERIFLKFSSLISISLLQSKDSKNHAILLPNTQTEFP